MANHTPKNFRGKVAQRSGYCCNYCKIERSRRKLTLDHIIPRFMGGAKTIDNCQLLCSDCHNRKSYIEQQAMVESPAGLYKIDLTQITEVV